jgi:transketolase
MSAAAHTGRTLAMGENEARSAGTDVVEAPFGKAMVQLGAVRPDVVGLTADLGKYTDSLRLFMRPPVIMALPPKGQGLPRV